MGESVSKCRQPNTNYIKQTTFPGHDTLCTDTEQVQKH